MLSTRWKKISNKQYFLVMIALTIALFCSFSMVVYRQYEDTQKVNAWALKDAEITHEIDHCYELGCSIYIIKPVEYDNFTDAIRKLGLMLAVVKVPHVYS